MYNRAVLSKYWGLSRVEAHLAAAIGVLAADRPALSQIVCHIDRRDVALLDVLRGRAAQRHLPHRRHVVEVRVLHHRVESVVADRPIGVAEHGLGVFAVVKVAQRAVAGRSEFNLPSKRDASGVICYRKLLRNSHVLRVARRQIQLLGFVVAVLDAARELQRFEAVSDAEAGRACAPSRRRSAGRSACRCRCWRRGSSARVGAKLTPVACVRPVSEFAVLIALLDDRRSCCPTSASSRRRPGCLRCRASKQPVVGALVLERVVQIHRRALGLQIARAELAAGAEVAVRDFGVDLQALGDPIGAADADAAVVLAVAVDSIVSCTNP